MTIFESIANNSDGTEARSGRLELPGRNPIQTPHYLAISSRGTVPHITQDNLAAETGIKGIYAGAEDYVDQLPKTLPASMSPCKGPNDSPLRRFIALKNDAVLVLGLRRLPPLAPPTPNTYTSVTISTATGFRQLEVSDYIAASEKMRPDIVIAPLDYEFGEGRPKPGLRRRDKMSERTLEWVRALLKSRSNSKQAGSPTCEVWAPMLPTEQEMQRSYLEYLEEHEGAFSGVALYETDSVALIPRPFQALPRLSCSDLKSPHVVLHAIDLGMDLFTLSFITQLTDAGIAFGFQFPAPPTPSPPSKLALGLDMWSSSHSTSLLPLQPDCTCYACRTHHRAYLRHLLDAKEMLAWTLLQIHNHHQIDLFFAGIRKSISQGTFVHDKAAFTQTYKEEFPDGSGAGPRLRGYQIRIATAGPPRANLPARRKLEKADWEAIEFARAEKMKEKLDDGAQRVGDASEVGLFAPDLDLEQELKGE